MNGYIENCYNKDPSKRLVDKTKLIVALRMQQYAISFIDCFQKRVSATGEPVAVKKIMNS